MGTIQDLQQQINDLQALVQQLLANGKNINQLPDFFNKEDMDFVVLDTSDLTHKKINYTQLLASAEEAYTLANSNYILIENNTDDISDLEEINNDLQDSIRVLSEKSESNKSNITAINELFGDREDISDDNFLGGTISENLQNLKLLTILNI